MYKTVNLQYGNTEKPTNQSQSILRIFLTAGLVILLAMISPFLLISLLFQAYPVLLFVSAIVGSSIYLLIKINNDKEGYF
ncbi:MAG: hypothetical protein ACOYN6_00145 [Ignavibacteria bacterium]